MRPKPNAQPNQSLIDGIATLQALATSTEPVGTRELARRLGFEATRVNRLLRTLAYLGIARQTADRKYTSGPGMHVLAAQSLFASGLIRRALPPLNQLRRFGLTVALGVLWRDNVTYLFHAPQGTDVSEALGRIGLVPATRGGIGMALLAALSDEEVRYLYAHATDIPRFPQGLEPLLLELQEIRANGYARVLVDPQQKFHTVAITVGDPVHSAIGLSGRIPKANTKTIVNALRAAAAEIEGLEPPKQFDQAPLRDQPEVIRSAPVL
jgi:DNA-binding IclR family transcriptional regulator